MKVIVLGAGVIGVTTAYFLARNGNQVTVIEKNSSPAMGCSHGNGGQLSYSHIDTWAAKASFLAMAKAALTPSSFLSLPNLFEKDFLKWLHQFYKNSSEVKAKENSRKLFRLTSFSREMIEQIIKEENIEFHYKKEGILHFFTKQKKFDSALIEADFHSSLGCKLQILNPDECVKKEPALIKLFNEKKLVGGIFYENDASGNSFLFTKALAEICQKKYGVNFEFDNEIKNILTNHKKITGINTANGVFTADKYVYALGAEGDKLLRGINVNSQIYPLKGYSLSIQSDEDYSAPKMALTDSENKIVYSRIGNIFRAAGTVEVNGLKSRKNKRHIRFLKNVVTKSFSDSGNMNQIEEWYGFRPFRPNSLPLVCEVKKYGNLLLNSGHGSLGWTLSCGCAKILSDITNNQQDTRFGFLEEEEENL
jgi:D-amino-acid dehydrogenase